MAPVTFDRAKKQFGDVVALTELSLHVGEGEFLVLVGPSGSGKTTALRLLAGLESLSAGHIRIGERSVGELAPRDRDIAMVFQDYALYPQMSVFDNLAFGLRTRKVPRREIARRVNDAAGMLSLDGLLHRKPRELSGGQRQRVALGRALVRQPQVFLMDEPLSNLDAKLRVQTRGEIKQLQQQVTTTTLYVTHDQVEAMTMGDRIAVLNEGLLEQVGEPYDVYENPANVFVACFIGSPAMSVATFSVRRAGDGVYFARDGVGFKTTANAALPAEVVVGIRPECARPWNEGVDLVGPLTGHVAFVEALGRETFVGVALSDDVQFVVELDGHRRISPGDTFVFGLERGRMHLFDARTERAIGRI